MTQPVERAGGRPRRPVSLSGIALAAVCLVVGVAASGCSSCRDEGGGVSAPTNGSSDQPVREGSGFSVYGAAGEGSAQGTANAELPEQPAVIVDGEVVLTIEQQEARLAEMVERYESLPSRQETTAAWRDERRERIADTAVEDFVMARHVRRHPPEISDEALQAHLQEALGAVYADEMLYARLLAQRGVTRDEYEASERQVLAEDILLSQRGSFEPTEDEIVAFYERNRDRFQEGERALVRTITVRVRRGSSDQELADAIERIQALHARVTTGGEDFADVATAESETLDRLNGGSMGWLVRGRRPELANNGVEDALFSAPLGQVTEPLRTDLGYQIFVVEDRREQGIRELDEVRATIAAPVRRTARERLRRDLIRELLADADVQYLRQQWRLETEAGAAP